ncbi:MAG: hypothetical protein ACODAQ_02270 [Phycisphaeraceae bacterium]
MAREDVIGNPRRTLKFISLVIGILMAAATVATMIYGRTWWIAVASAVVSAWSLLIFTELLKQDLHEMLRGERDDDSTSDT